MFNLYFILESGLILIHLSGRSALPQSALQLFQPRDIRGCRRRDPEPVRLLLAAQHRCEGGREEGEGAAYTR
jgi:hypothetical protein